MAYDPDNIFAKILRGEAPCVKVFEDEKTLAFMDVMPQTPGHVLVVPKSPSEDLLGLDPDYAAAAIRTTQKLARAVKTAMQTPGVMIAQLNGAEAGQSVFHIHFHIIPREGGINLKLHAREMADTKELEEQAARIRAALD